MSKLSPYVLPADGAEVVRDEEVPLPEEQVELEVEGEDGGRGRHDQRREGGAERHAQQEVVGGAALRPEGLQGGYSVV